MAIVSNATTLINFSAIDHLDILRELFEEVIIPEAMRDEITAKKVDIVTENGLKAKIKNRVLQEAIDL